MTHLNKIGLAAAISLIPAAASAGQPIVVQASPQPTAIVSYADLDLGRAAGRATLDGRVRRAAEVLCLDLGVRDLGDRMAQKGCLNFAVAGARGQIEQAVAAFGGTPLPGRKAIVVAAR